MIEKLKKVLTFAVALVVLLLVLSIIIGGVIRMVDVYIWGIPNQWVVFKWLLVLALGVIFVMQYGPVLLMKVFPWLYVVLFVVKLGDGSEDAVDMVIVGTKWGNAIIPVSTAAKEAAKPLAEGCRQVYGLGFIPRNFQESYDTLHHGAAPLAHWLVWL